MSRTPLCHFLRRDLMGEIEIRRMMGIDNSEKSLVFNDLKLLAEVLDESLQLLSTLGEESTVPATVGSVQSSLFEQCIELCRQSVTDFTEPVRTIHHLSCTGGTLITKCLAAMPNVLVLNEVDPLSPMCHFGFFPGKILFTPSDMISLVRQGDPKVPEKLIIKLFLQNLELLHEEMRLIGKRLLLRDHSHSHFLTGNKIEQRPDLLTMVKGRFDTLSIVTVRDPAESFLSLQNNWWINFEPETFDEYCRRYNAFLDTYAGVPIFCYEDFVKEPSSVAGKMCDALDLKYSECFIDTFDTFVFSGDSGRKGSVIEPRPRRIFDEKIIKAASESKNYGRLIDRLGYEKFWK